LAKKKPEPFVPTPESEELVKYGARLQKQARDAGYTLDKGGVEQYLHDQERSERIDTIPPGFAEWEQRDKEAAELLPTDDRDRGQPLSEYEKARGLSTIVGPKVHGAALGKLVPILDNEPFDVWTTKDMITITGREKPEDMTIESKLLVDKMERWKEQGKQFRFWSDADGFERGFLTEHGPPTFEIRKYGEAKPQRIYTKDGLDYHISGGRAPHTAKVPKQYMKVEKPTAERIGKMKFQGKKQRTHALLGGKRVEWRDGNPIWGNEKMGDNTSKSIWSDWYKAIENEGFKVPVEYGHRGHFMCSPTCNLNDEVEVDAATASSIATLGGENRVNLLGCRYCQRPFWWKDYPREGLEAKQSKCKECAQKGYIKRKKKMNGNTLFEWDSDSISKMLEHGTQGKPVSKTAYKSFMKQVFG